MPRKNEQAINNAWSAPLSGLASLLIVDMLIAYLVPTLSNSNSTVFTQLTPARLHQIIALTLVTAATVIFLAYFRAKFYFSNRWLIAATAYNFLILFVKFTLSTNEITSKNAHDFGPILSTAFLVSLLYIFANVILYLFFDGRLLNKNLHKALVVSSEGKVLLAMGLFLCVTVVRIVAFRLPGLSNTAAAGYLGDVFKANTALLSGLLFIMIIAAVETYAQVRRRVDLKYFFVISTCLILIAHLTWAIFVYRVYR
jgi:hypothetical protein